MAINAGEKRQESFSLDNHHLKLFSPWKKRRQFFSLHLTNIFQIDFISETLPWTLIGKQWIQCYL